LRRASQDELTALGRREGVGLPHLPPEALDQPVADRERGEERDLLGGDRGDERLERVRGERRAEAGEPVGQAAQHRVVPRPGVEGAELEGRPEQRERHRPRLVVERLDLGPAGRGLDPHLTRADDAVEGAVDPEVREVGPERAEALGRQLEVERLR
jgi:hypothetical protein